MKHKKWILLGAVSVAILAGVVATLGYQTAKTYEQELSNLFVKQMREQMPKAALSHCYGQKASAVDKSDEEQARIKQLLVQGVSDSQFEVRVQQCYGTWWYQKEASKWVQEQQDEVQEAIVGLMQNNPAWWSVFVDSERVQALWQDQEGKLYDDGFAQLSEQNVWHQALWLELWGAYFVKNNVAQPLPRLSAGAKQRQDWVVKEVQKAQKVATSNSPKKEDVLDSSEIKKLAYILYSFEFPIAAAKIKNQEQLVEMARSKADAQLPNLERDLQTLRAEEKIWIERTFGTHAQR